MVKNYLGETNLAMEQKCADVIKAWTEAEKSVCVCGSDRGGD